MSYQYSTFLVTALLVLTACGSAPPGAELQVSNGTLSFVGAANSQTLEIRNVGSQDTILSWSVSGPLTVSPSSGTVRARETATLTIFRPERSEDGLQTRHLSVRSSAGAKTVYVIY